MLYHLNLTISPDPAVAYIDKSFTVPPVKHTDCAVDPGPLRIFGRSKTVIAPENRLVAVAPFVVVTTT